MEHISRPGRHFPRAGWRSQYSVQSEHLDGNPLQRNPSFSVHALLLLPAAKSTAVFRKTAHHRVHPSDAGSDDRHLHTGRVHFK